MRIASGYETVAEEVLGGLAGGVFYETNRMRSLAARWASHDRRQYSKQEEKHMTIKHILRLTALIAVAVAALGLSACSTPDESGTHHMGGRGQSGPMSDEMMPGTQ